MQDNVDLLFVNNGNDPRVREELRHYAHLPHKQINLGKNFYDISVHMCSYWRAVELGAPYFAYTYDDFVFYDSYWVEPSVKFMNTYNNVACIRLPKYVYGDRTYDTRYVPKNLNPESVRHEDGAAGHPLEMIVVDSGKKELEDRDFYFSNWRPNSRPMMWRVDSFQKMIEGREKLPVMQSFEKLMYAHADALGESYTSGFINNGVCHTFPIETSERTQVSNHYRDVEIDVAELRKAYEDSK
jgi:hypothetical protein